MIRRSLLTAALIVAGSVIAAPKTMAQSVDVPFTGTVGGVCNINNVTGGTLVPNQEVNPTALYTQTTGNVNLSCNQTALVSITQPMQTGGPAFTPVYGYGYAYGYYGGSYTITDGTTVTHSIPSGTTDLSVQAYLDKGSPLTPGNYSYVTTLTVTPN